jgi:hypothetical protein
MTSTVATGQLGDLATWQLGDFATLRLCGELGTNPNGRLDT